MDELGIITKTLKNMEQKNENIPQQQLWQKKIRKSKDSPLFAYAFDALCFVRTLNSCKL